MITEFIKEHKILCAIILVLIIIILIVVNKNSSNKQAENSNSFSEDMLMQETNYEENLEENQEVDNTRYPDILYGTE